MADEHNHGASEETLREEVLVVMRLGIDDVDGRLIKLGSQFYFEDMHGNHVSTHVWRIK